MYPNVRYNIYILRQCLLTLAIVIDCFIGGAGVTFSATVLPQLQRNDTTLKITQDESAWIASSMYLGAVLGPIIGTILNELIGRKWTYTSISLINATAWTIIASSSEVWQLLLGRILQGITYSMGYPVLYCFVCEVIFDKYRSIMLNFMSIGLTMGMLFADVIGTFYSWRLIGQVLAVLSLFYFVIFIYLKNTYVWYLDRSRMEEAKLAFVWYRGESQSAIDEFNNKQRTLTSSISLRQLVEECKKREFLLPLLIVFWFQTTLVCSGASTIVLYSVQIINNIVSFDGYVITIVIDILRIFSCITTSILLYFLPVRYIVIVSSIICSVTLFAICGSLYWKDTWEGLSWVAVVSILIFTVFFNLGFINICAISTGELFTGISKSTGISLAQLYYFGISFIFAAILPLVVSQDGIVWLFLMFGVSCIIGGIGLYIMLPETRNVTNDQIKEYFKSAPIFFR